MNSFYKYIFVSHSSKDWKKVRIIRNYIENQKFYPLLFHLKCLEKEPLLPKDKNRLKKILKEEIASRGRFLLCNSKNSSTSEFVKWEKKEVNKHSNIIIKEIELDQPISHIKSQLKLWTSKLNTIAFIYTWQGYKLYLKLQAALAQIDTDLKFISFADDGHIPIFQGCIPQNGIDYIQRQVTRLTNASIIIPLITNDYYERGFCSKVEYIVSHINQNILIPIDLTKVSHEQLGIKTDLMKNCNDDVDATLTATIRDKIISELYK